MNPLFRRRLVSSSLVILVNVFVDGEARCDEPEPRAVEWTRFEVGGHPAFAILPPEGKRAAGASIPWVFYAPTFDRRLPNEKDEGWMIRRFLEAGIGMAGIDVGESYGSPAGRATFDALHREVGERFGFSGKACLLARSRGGLMLYNWAVEHPDKVACIAGIYPVCDLRSYPGLVKACGAYGMTETELAAALPSHNPVDRLAPLAGARVPIFHIHGDADTVVPLEANSGALAGRYRGLGGAVTLVVPEGQGHNMWRGFFECGELVDFVIEHAAATAGEGRPAGESNAASSGGGWRRGVAATSHPLATRAAVAAMEGGGNAIDGAVAALLTLGVVDSHNAGIGGGCFLLVRAADGTVAAIDGRERAPLAAHRDLFVRGGVADPDLSQTGALAAGVPGALAACGHVLERFGRRSLAELLEPAARIADEGFVIDGKFASRLRETRDDLRRFEATRAVLLGDDGETPWAAGDRLVQADLATTYRAIAAEGIGWFYEGPFAEAVEAWMRSNGGIMTSDDLRAYRIAEREPVRTTYRGLSVVGFPPPSSGGIHVAQVLGMLERFDLAAMEEADRAHVIVEALKLAFADRAFWLGDPDFAEVPRGLVDRGYVRALGDRIELARAIEVPAHGDPPAGEGIGFFGEDRHTTHFSVADAEGNWVACTATLNTPFGSKVIVPGTGILLNNQMDDFSAQPGVPNFFGLVGAEANAVAPGKRPLSSMSPTLVFDAQGEPVLSAGAAGGPTIISQVVLALVRRIDLGWSPERCLADPRVHHQWKPDAVRAEAELDPDVRAALEARGHLVEVRGSIGVTQMIGRERSEGGDDGWTFFGVADPRAPGSAGGW